jgi:curved DNA-binding protein CbpA
MSSRRSWQSFSTKAQGATADDYYQLLRVSRTATLSEIKVSYRRLALQYHPDRHDGCSEKEEQFKEINHAYGVLISAAKRRQYDAEQHTTSSHRSRADSRTSYYQSQKVYAPSPPPEWKGGVWNHQRHYDMHYGDGFVQEAFQRLRRRSRDDSSLDYQSPLGRGFTFESGSGHQQANTNPYSKAPQGPPKLVMEYEEIDRDMRTGQEHVSKREQVVEDLYQRRQERYNNNSGSSGSGTSNRKASTDARQQQQEQQSVNAAFVRRQQNDNCIIL